MKITNAGKRDYAGITQLYLDLNAKKSHKRKDRFAGVRLYSRTFAARESGKVVGFILATHSAYASSRVGYIEELIVDEGYRGTGVGSALVRKALKWEEAHNAEVVFVTTPYLSAIAFYKKHGFAPLIKNKWLRWIPKSARDKMKSRKPNSDTMTRRVKRR